MYWKILTAVLCFYAVVPVEPTASPAAPTTTGNATTTATAANTTITAANNITRSANTTTTAVPTTATAANTTSTSANNITTFANTTTTAVPTEATAAPTTTTAAPSTTPSPPVVLDLVFSSDDVFSPALTNTSSPLFQSLVTKTIQALEPLFKENFPNFIRMIVVGFRRGSIITDAQLEFAAANTTANATTPFADAVATTLKAAITNGSLSINISANFKITEPSPSTAAPTTTGNSTATATSANTTTTVVPTTATVANATTTAAKTTTAAAPKTTTAAPTTTPSPPVIFDLEFRSDDVFSPALTNTSSPLFQSLVTKTIQALEPLFKTHFPNFIRMIVLGFRSGSIITDTQLEFAAVNTTANATTPFADAVATTLKAAITNGSLSINISAIFKITVKPTPSAASPTTTGNAKKTTTPVPTTTTAVKTTTTAANTTTTAVPKTATAANTTYTSAKTTTKAAKNITTAANNITTAAPTTTTAANTATTAVPKTTTAAPTTTTAAPTTTPSPAFVLKLVFRSDDVFSPALTNTSSPLFQSLVMKTIKALEPLFKAHFPNFIRMIVLGFRRGSIITDAQLEFAAVNTTANATTPFADAVATTLKAAITNGSLSINISTNFNITVLANPTTAAPTTTTAAPLTTTAAPTTTTRAPTTTTAAVAPTTTAAPNVLLLEFSSDETFTETLSNNASQAFRDRATTIKNEIEPVYRKVFRSFIQLVVLSFKRGSIITSCRMEFGLTGNGIAPTADMVKKVLVDEVNNGNLNIRVNASSIVVNVLSSSMSPVVNSVFSSFGMTLVFLLLSAAMHRL
ncbi:mucin-5AC isoform X2 [Oncorhynchus mykiss]|uniref:mucin-5AC isoform X2 n=1 Tax=Oncorhynchus mykiss TaxID=8022 RepID=UPI0018784F06|nr:mucin-5AC isoform X2 [Oncorhynchus mykiss]